MSGIESNWLWSMVTDGIVGDYIIPSDAVELFSFDSIVKEASTAATGISLGIAITGF